MPKILNCTKEEMVQTARAILLEKGYDAFNIREVASACGVSVGTIYTYFSSKNVLVVHAIAIDWFQLLEESKQKSASWQYPEDGIEQFYMDMRQFAFKYRAFFLAPAVNEKEMESSMEGYRFLTAQIHEVMSRFLLSPGKEDDRGLCAFLANVLVSYVHKALIDPEDSGYGQVRPYIQELLKTNRH